MRWYVSYPILAVGLAIGADILFPGEPAVSRSSSSVASHAIQEFEPTSPHHPDVVPTVVLASEIEFASRLAAFSPGARILPLEAPRVSVLDYLAQKLSPLDFTPAVTTPATAQPISGTTWKSVVIREAEPVYQKALVRERDVNTPRDALARDIQTELTRVGCYLGEVDGVWGIGSRRAVSIFMDRINASLPTHDPDVFMLSLLRAQDDAVCGPSCPSGQSFASNGRCVPTTLVAHGDKAIREPAAQSTTSETAAIASEAAWEPVVAAAPVLIRPPTPYYGRMSIGGPKPIADTSPSNGEEAVTIKAAAADRLERTAALETSAPSPAEADRDTVTDPERLPMLTTTSFDTQLAEPARPRVKASGARSKSAGRSSPSRSGNYRHVQRLFEHPLGRM